jgi:hypothetical protein
MTPRLHSLTSITVDRQLIPTADNSAARTTGFKAGWSSMKSATGGLNVALFT